MSYIYELLQAPAPADEWTTEYDFNESPSAFPIADWVNAAEDRETVIARFGAWLEENRLGFLNGEMFIIDKEAADRHFEGRLYDILKAQPESTTVLLVSHQISKIDALATRHVIVDRKLTECTHRCHYAMTDCAD